MKTLLTTTLSLLSLAPSLLAQDTEPRERVHSVRKVVDSIGKIEAKDISVVASIRTMFSEGKVSGQLRTIYAGYIQKESEVSDNYATAFGGILKYELAEFHGFNAALAAYASHDIASLSGNSDAHNPELSSSTGSYSDIAEAYINYKYKEFNLRIGRQTLATPLADSDDVRMIQNSFEAYVASYTYNGLEFMAGNIQRWQGTGVGLDAAWREISENNKSGGTSFAGISYHDGLEFNTWVYHIPSLTNALYLDIGVEYPINEDFMFHTVFQYLKENSIDDTPTAADIYGLLMEFVAYDLGINLALNRSNRQEGKESFSGTGGGTLFTNMDTMTLDNISRDRDTLSYVAGLVYNIDQFGFLYAHGDFVGDADGTGVKEHILEHDIGFEYNFNDEFLLSAIYVISEDLENYTKSEYDFTRVQVMMHYSF